MAKRLLFIHHSTGGNLIYKGHLRETLYSKTKEIEFLDHGYNLYTWLPLPILRTVANKLTFHTGLSDKDGKITGRDFQIELSNNNPADFEKVLALKEVLDFDIIAFKNCYPTTKIVSDEQLERYKVSYVEMTRIFADYPDKIFIAFTPPPLRKELTQPKYAKRAKEFTDWLTTKWEKPQNVVVFDFFGLLADKNGYLTKQYCSPLTFDSHPNTKANKEISPKFVDFLTSIV